MTAPQTPTKLLSVDPTRIPESLKAQPRWAVWEARWKPQRNKYDKIPQSPSGYNLSTARPEAWVPYDVALRAYQGNPTRFAGIGYLMTGADNLVGIDLDHCIDAQGGIAPWARDIINGVASYTEVSPSGTGVRVFTEATIANDWLNHEIGIEVYGGHGARFLTVTGYALPGMPGEVTRAPAGLLSALEARHAKEREQATVVSLAMPDVLDDLSLPDVETLGLPPRESNFLSTGEVRGDRSEMLQNVATALFVAGLSQQQVFSVMVNNPHAFGVALDHRDQDHDRALRYIWVHQCQNTKVKASSKVATVDDFEVVADTGNTASGPTAATPEKPARFRLQDAHDFMEPRAVKWLIKNVLPHAGVGALYGPSTAGKSFLALDMAMAIARGVPWRGRKTTKGAVVYVCAEGGGGFRMRVQAYNDFHEVDRADVVFKVLDDAPNFLVKTDIKDLVAALAAVPDLVLVVVDTLAQVTPGANENSGEDMGLALAHCKTVHQATKAMVLLVAHTGKDESKGLRGWSGVRAALDFEMSIERNGEERTATVTKQKDGPGEGESFGFGLTTVELGKDEDGEPIGSAVLADRAVKSRAERKGPVAGIWQQLVLRVAGTLKDMPGDLTSVALIESAVSEMPFVEGKKDRRRERVVAALESLVASNHLSVTDGNVRLL